MRERAVVNMIRKRLAECPASYVLNLHATGYGRRGVPDILWVHRGQAIFIEAKTKTGRCTKLQEYEGRHIVNAGATWEVIYNREELTQLIERVTRDRDRRSSTGTA